MGENLIADLLYIKENYKKDGERVSTKACEQAVTGQEIMLLNREYIWIGHEDDFLLR